MIPVTDAECDAYIADVSAAIMAALAPNALAADQANAAYGLPPELERNSRVQRAAWAVSEAGALLAELQLHARVQRFPDGEPIDSRAKDPTKQFCAHGVSMADECAECAKGPTGPIVETDAGNAAAVQAFKAGLAGEPPA